MSKYLLAFLIVTLPWPRAIAAEELANEHVDISMVFDSAATDAKLDIQVLIERTRILPLDQVTFIVRENARLELPPGTPFGEEGESIWVLPQSQNTTLLYMGFSAERIPFGVFDGPLQLELVSVQGPGHFFVWQSTSVGNLEIKMNTRDGIGPGDKTTPFIGSHEHVNWGFSTNGIYKVTFRAVGRLIGQETNMVTPLRTLTFHVLPLPLTPFAQWQLEKFGDAAPADTKGPGADPDADSISNIFEYAFSLDPSASMRTNLPAAWIDATGSGIEFLRATRATDLQISVETTELITPTNWHAAVGSMETVSQSSGLEQIRFRDARPITTQRFYRLQLSLPP